MKTNKLNLTGSLSGGFSIFPFLFINDRDYTTYLILQCRIFQCRDSYAAGFFSAATVMERVILMKKSAP